MVLPSTNSSKSLPRGVLNPGRPPHLHDRAERLAPPEPRHGLSEIVIIDGVEAAIRQHKRVCQIGDICTPPRFCLHKGTLRHNAGRGSVHALDRASPHLHFAARTQMHPDRRYLAILWHALAHRWLHDLIQPESDYMGADTDSGMDDAEVTTPRK